MSSNSPTATAILLAGGSGSRMGSAISDKILMEVGGKSVFRHSVDAFVASKSIQNIVVVYRDLEQREALAAQVVRIENVQFTWALGGEERQFSVWSGLQQVLPETDIVLIHDCARPLVTSRAINQTIEAAQIHGAACLARKTTDTIKQVDQDNGSYIPTTIDRSRLWSMETPQVFQFTLIRDAYRTVIDERQSITDDLSAVESLGIPIVFVENGRPNPKLTTSDDLAYIDFLISRLSQE